MKRYLIKHLITTLLLATSFIAKPAVTVYVADAAGMVNDTITVSVVTDQSLTGLEVSAWQFNLNYNASYMHYIDASTVGTLSQTWGAPLINSKTSGKIQLTHAGAAALSGSGTIVKMRFKLLNNGTVYVNMENTSLLNEGNPSLITGNGRITISAPPTISVSPSSGTIAIGDKLNFYAYSGTAPYTWGVSDATVASISASGQLTGLKRGWVRVLVTDYHGVTSQSANLIEVRPFKMVINDTTYYQNNWIDIPIRVSSLNVEQVTSGRIELQFTPSVLKAESLILTGTLLAGVASHEFNLSDEGLAVLTFAGTQNLTGSGVLFKVRFRIANTPSGGSYISITNAVLNEELYSVIDNSYFHITALPPLYISPGTSTLLVGTTLDFDVSGGTAPYTWEVIPASIGTINSSGLFTPLKGGDAMIKVTDMFGAVGQTGTISVYDAQLTVGEVNTPENVKNVTIPVNITALPAGREMVSFSANLPFYSSQINKVAVNSAGGLINGWSIAQNQTANQFSMASAGTAGIIGNNRLFNLDIELANVSSGQIVYLNLADVIANEGSPRLQIDQGRINITQATDINTNEGNDLTIYPNPANNFIYIKSIQPILSIGCIDITGRMRNISYSQNDDRQIINTSSLESGLYLFSIRTTSGTFCQKVKVSH